MIGRKDRHEVFFAGPDYHDFCMPASFDVLDLGNSLCSDGFGVLKNFVLHLFFVQAVNQSFGYFHRQPPDQYSKQVRAKEWLLFYNAAEISSPCMKMAPNNFGVPGRHPSARLGSFMTNKRRSGPEKRVHPREH